MRSPELGGLAFYDSTAHKRELRDTVVTADRNASRKVHKHTHTHRRLMAYTNARIHTQSESAATASLADDYTINYVIVHLNCGQCMS